MLSVSVVAIPWFIGCFIGVTSVSVVDDPWFIGVFHCCGVVGVIGGCSLVHSGVSLVVCCKCQWCLFPGLFGCFTGIVSGACFLVHFRCFTCVVLSMSVVPVP